MSPANRPLLGWYRQEIETSVGVSKWINRRILLIIGAAWIFPTLQWGVAASMSEAQADELRTHAGMWFFTGNGDRQGMQAAAAEHQGQADGIRINMVIVNVVFVLIVLFVAVQLGRFAARNRGKEIAATAAPTLRRIVGELQSAMELSRTVILTLSPHDGLLPSIEWDSEPRLIVSRRLIAMASTNEPKVRAMLAHELGHVCQRDVHLWGIASLFNRAFLLILIPGMALLVVASAVSGVSLNVLAVAWCCWQVFRIRRAAFDARRTSEELADLAALIFVGGDPIISALEHLVDTEHVGVHPSKRDRIDSLKSYVNASEREKAARRH